MSILPCSAWAETPVPTSSITPEQRRLVSDERAAEVKRLIEVARERQKVIDRQNTDLWTRWTYAVCIGCEEVRTTVRVVYTNPLRVLAGVPAAMDDRRMPRLRQPTLASIGQAKQAAHDRAQDALRASQAAAKPVHARGRISDHLPTGGTLA